jgi:large subunit ribosomal protein L16
MQQPKRVKYRKVQRGSRRGKANSGNVVSFGDFGLQALESAWVTAAQIEAARRAITPLHPPWRQGMDTCLPG